MPLIIASLKKIVIRIGKVEDCVRVYVYNIGKHIPEEDIERIWDKFYKVDMARTREVWRNGIGLSIVKAIMDSYGNSWCFKMLREVLNLV